MTPDSRKLLGKYRTPRFKYGQKVICEARGEVTIVKLSAGPIPWPIARREVERGVAMVLYRDLARAVRREARNAVADAARSGPGGEDCGGHEGQATTGLHGRGDAPADEGT
jgi:hypothetical protein